MAPNPQKLINILEYFAKKGYVQQDIAKLANISQSSISRIYASIQANKDETIYMPALKQKMVDLYKQLKEERRMAKK